ncbi:hypothetical protein NEIPOLOT_00812 [Neisseria polysaccharea ATCC 43768]|nr:hypothetical protein NEIPOLOT_00812 [Neisseria polysaccharea ATCC 43768]
MCLSNKRRKDGHRICGRRQDAAAVYLEAILRQFAPIAEKPLKNAALSNRQKTG